MKEAVLEKFRELFGDAEGVNVYFAPGRVNLIGEHTDYNGAPWYSTIPFSLRIDDRYLCGCPEESGQETHFLFHEF